MSHHAPPRWQTLALAFLAVLAGYWVLAAGTTAIARDEGLAGLAHHLVPTSGEDLADRLLATGALALVAVWALSLRRHAMADRRELERAADRLVETEQRLRLAARVFESTIEGIVVTDPNGSIQMVNPAFTAITGYSREEAIGNNPRLLKSDRHDETFYDEMWGRLLERGSWSGEIWNRNKLGEAYPEWLNINAIRDPAGSISNYVAVFHDLSDLHRSHERIQHLAYHDPLTGLPNRLLLDDRLRVALAQARRSRTLVAVVFIDLDDFKRINDTFGHPAGDSVLQQVARRLESCVREEDTVSRRSGDEFVVVLNQLPSPVAAMRVGQAILRALANPFAAEGSALRLSATLGAAVFPIDGATPEELLRKADLAMYEAKQRGKNLFQPFTREMGRALDERLELEAALRQAIGAEAVEVEYLPMVEPGSSRLVAVEALARWQQPDGALVSPERFLRLAEDSGLVVPMGRAVLRRAAHDLARWRDAGHRDVTIALNLSAREIFENDLAAAIRDAVGAGGLVPADLTLEIAEAVLADFDLGCRRTIDDLTRLGVRLVVDGYRGRAASLSQLTELPVAGIKLDRALVEARDQDASALNLVVATVAAARSLDLEVAACGVSTHAQLAVLREHGITAVQGYLIGRPGPFSAVQRWLEQGLRLAEPGADASAASS